MNLENFACLINDHADFTFKTFPLGSCKGALLHAKREIDEILSDIDADLLNAEEFADLLGCIVDAISRSNKTPDEIYNAWVKKLDVNRRRDWKYNGDGSYSHVK